MAYTNAQLVRLELGDTGLPMHDVASGDGITTAFYLSAPPILAASEVVTVAGTPKTRTTDYTIDGFSGALAFLVAPSAGSSNIVVTYTAVQIADVDVTEALRQYGLVDSASADTGRPVVVLQAALLLAEGQAARWAGVGDVTTDGTKIEQGANSQRWLAKAEALRQVLARSTGVTSVPMVRVDAYNTTDATTRDVGATTATNPRRAYYGDPDRLP